MTTEHAVHGASTLVSTASNNDLKRMLSLSNDGTVRDQHMQDVILLKEEEKMMDEEITSLESNDRGVDEGDDDNIVENAMLNVAILNSVASQGESRPVVNKSALPPSSIVGPFNVATQQQQPLNRYGLRQRRNGSLVGEAGEQQLSPQSAGKESMPTNLKHTTNSTQTVNNKSSSTKTTAVTKSINRPPRPAKRKRSGTGANVEGFVNQANISMVYGNENQQTTTILSPSHQPHHPFLNVITSVPNPLSSIVDTTQSQQNHTNTDLSATSGASTVRKQILQPSSMDNASQHLNEDTVPCPLPSMFDPYATTAHLHCNIKVDPSFVCTGNDQKQRVTFSETTETRDRSFSIDLDLALGFGDEQSAGDGEELNIISGAGGRNRAYSFECFAFGINSDEPLPQMEQSMQGPDATGGREIDDNLMNHPGRPRGDSIVFDQLRPREDSLVFEDLSRLRADSFVFDHLTLRPRGDSIIFDPTSFQDGGIHEQRVLYDQSNTSGVALSDHVDNLVDNLLQGVVTDPEPNGVSSTAVVLPALIISSDVKGAIESSMSPIVNNASTKCGTQQTQNDDSSPVSNLVCSTAIPYDILNKDGRIGIYLPEARRERIARFLAKRNKRIWRKRIKYDCRKKLADSRPRIKGRFVKRSDD